ncbi:hypothetical protein LTR94_038799, partial [Friedmanniomyces endolithicus]
MGDDIAAARRVAGAAMHQHVVALDLHLDAIGGEQGGGRGDAVALLHPQLGQAAEAADTGGAGGGHRQDR